jgi:hypothetical protein
MPLTLSDHGASFGFSANVSRRMRANHGANPKGSKKGRGMNDAQTLVLIHTVAWPILIGQSAKHGATHDFPSEAQIDDESRSVVLEMQWACHGRAQ